MNPARVDSMRRQRLRSPNSGIASKLMINGAVNPNASVSASREYRQEIYQLTVVNDDTAERANTIFPRIGRLPPNWPASTELAGDLAGFPRTGRLPPHWPERRPSAGALRRTRHRRRPEHAAPQQHPRDARTHDRPFR